MKRILLACIAVLSLTGASLQPGIGPGGGGGGGGAAGPPGPTGPAGPAGADGGLLLPVTCNPGDALGVDQAGVNVDCPPGSDYNFENGTVTFMGQNITESFVSPGNSTSYDQNDWTADGASLKRTCAAHPSFSATQGGAFLDLDTGVADIFGACQVQLDSVKRERPQSYSMYGVMASAIDPDTTNRCGNASSGGNSTSTAPPTCFRPINPIRDFRLLSISATVYDTTGTIGGWSAGNRMHVALFLCVMDSTPSVSDCTPVGKLVFVNGSPAANSNEVGCTGTGGLCTGSIYFEGSLATVVRPSTFGPAGGSANYLMIGYQNSGGDWTTALSSTTTSIIGTAEWTQ